MIIQPTTYVGSRPFFQQAESLDITVHDADHQDVIHMLAELRRLMQLVTAQGAGTVAQRLARSTHLYFSSTALPHHLNEERLVFPRLLCRATSDMAAAVARLTQDHGQIELQWFHLVPCLDGIARGYAPDDLERLRSHVEFFITSYLEHIRREEALLYPEGRTWLSPVDIQSIGRDMARRRIAVSGRGDVSEHDDDDGPG